MLGWQAVLAESHDCCVGNMGDTWHRESCNSIHLFLHELFFHQNSLSLCLATRWTTAFLGLGWVPLNYGMERTTFLTRKMNCDEVTLGVSKVLLNYLINIACEYELVQRQRTKKRLCLWEARNKWSTDRHELKEISMLEIRINDDLTNTDFKAYLYGYQFQILL